MSKRVGLVLFGFCLELQLCMHRIVGQKSCNILIWWVVAVIRVGTLVSFSQGFVVEFTSVRNVINLSAMKCIALLCKTLHKY